MLSWMGTCGRELELPAIARCLLRDRARGWTRVAHDQACGKIGNVLDDYRNDLPIDLNDNVESVKSRFSKPFHVNDDCTQIHVDYFNSGK